MCMSTRFPEAIPLRKITTQAVTKALTKFFTIFGLPLEVQTDQGSNFTSKMFEQIMKELGIKHIMATAYRPQSQGALERYHQTLKNMIKKYCLESEKDWDQGIHMLLFATREVVQESLGFSPFELVFGHTVRGPLQTIKEQWLGAEGRQTDENILDHVKTFRYQLYKAGKMAEENLKQSQEKMKTWYDQKARDRVFEPGDKVLIFLPVTGSPLRASFRGPYLVKERLNDLNYVIKTTDRRKSEMVCHVNMIKPY